MDARLTRPVQWMVGGLAVVLLGLSLAPAYGPMMPLILGPIGALFMTLGAWKLDRSR